MDNHQLNLQETSKFLSFVLRHKPEAIGLSLDSEGWANIENLIICSRRDNKFLTKEVIYDIAATSDKKRFSISSDGLRIRAVQGHSSKQVSIAYEEKEPPELLYHGTATRFYSSIQEKGLLPMSRQYVHLSMNEITATAVGQRHGKAIVLKIQAHSMFKRGFKFYHAENGVWLTPIVPFEFISISG
jgi:putative RNA 2'-phosphotransferase